MQIVVSLATQRVNIYKGGEVIASAKVSTGKSGHRTPSGVFSIIQKRKMHFSNLYDNAPMPFMQRMTWSGIALHAGNVSRPYQSHGCIRMPYGFAKKLFKSTRMGAHVIVASGSSSMQPISHMSLIQPMSSGPLLASKGVRTAALSTDTPVKNNVPVLEAGKVPGFIDPVVVATRHLQQKQLDQQAAVAAGPQYKQALEQAQAQLAHSRQQLGVARKLGQKAQKSLRKTRLAVRRLKRQRASQLRAHSKAQWRANWARDILEKRRDTPKYEGKWMEMASARVESRDAYEQQTKARHDETSRRLDVATASLDLVTKEMQKARELVATRNNGLRAAVRLLKQARQEYGQNQRRVIAENKNIKIATAAIHAAKARQKLPLRILITPRTGIERIKAAQRLLAEIGYEPGYADGKVGKNTRLAINAFQQEITVAVTGKISDKLIEELHSRAGRAQPKSAHMYVRQGFTKLFDTAVDIAEPGKPLGTHLFTAMHFEKGAGAAKWTAVTIKSATGRSARKGKKAGKRLKTTVVAVSAQQALDRITLPAPVRRQLSMLLTPGSSMVISDKGMSHETGKGTDFVVLTR